MTELALTPCESTLWDYLMHCWHEQGVSLQRSIKSLATDLGLSRVTVWRALSRLSRRGLIGWQYLRAQHTSLLTRLTPESLEDLESGCPEAVSYPGHGEGGERRRGEGDEEVISIKEECNALEVYSATHGDRGYMPPISQLGATASAFFLPPTDLNLDLNPILNTDPSLLYTLFNYWRFMSQFLPNQSQPDNAIPFPDRRRYCNHPYFQYQLLPFELTNENIDPDIEQQFWEWAYCEASTNRDIRFPDKAVYANAWSYWLKFKREVLRESPRALSINYQENPHSRQSSSHLSLVVGGATTDGNYSKPKRKEIYPALAYFISKMIADGNEYSAKERLAEFGYTLDDWNNNVDGIQDKAK